MRKNKIVVLLLLATIFAFSMAFAACNIQEQHVCKHVCETCGKCTDATCTDPVCADKCPGHAPAHVCKHVCETCGKCTDATCTDPVCAEKCPGHAHVCKHVCPICEGCQSDCTDEVCKIKCDCAATLAKAASNVKALYINNAEATAADYTVVPSVRIRDLLTEEYVTFTVTWSIEVEPGQTVPVTVVKSTGEGGAEIVTITIVGKSDVARPYTLVATVADKDGNTEVVKFNRNVPAYKALTFAEFVATKDDDNVVIRGIVTGIMSKTNGNSTNCLYLQDLNNEGGYYLYNLSTDPVEDNIEIGMKVEVSGQKDTYNGTLEVINCAITVMDDGAKTNVVPVDYTEKFTNAAKLTDTDLVYSQAMLVTVKNVEMVAVDGDYVKFKLGDKTSYIRLSSSVCPIISEIKAMGNYTDNKNNAFVTKHNEHVGWTGDVTGVICVYDGAFYLTPVSINAISYNALPVLGDAEAVAFEKDKIQLVDRVSENKTINLTTKGVAYDDVVIAWDFKEGTTHETATIVDGVLTITLGDKSETITLVATISRGEAKETKEFQIEVLVSNSFIGQALKAGEALADKATTTDNYVIAGTVSKITTAYSSQYKNVTFYVSDGTYEIMIFRYNLDDAENIKVGDYIALSAPIKKWGSDIEAVATFVKLDLVNIETAAALEKGTKASVYGKIASIDTAYSEQYGNITVTITDGTNSFKCFRLAGGADLMVGDYILVSGTIDVYKEVAQFGAGATYTKDAIYVEPVVEKTDAEKVAEAKAALEATTTSVSKVGEVTLPTADGFTLAYALADGTTLPEGITFADGKLTVTALPAADTEITFVVTITLNETTDTATVKVTVKAAVVIELDHAGTEEDPYSVKDVLAATKNLSKDEYTENMVFVKGIVVSFDVKGTYLGNIYLVDEVGSTVKFLVFSCNFTDAVKAVAVGDTVVVKGAVKNYNGTIEMTNVKVDDTTIHGYPTFVAIVVGDGTIAVDDNSSENATVAVTDNQTTGKNHTTFTFTVTVADGYELVSVKVDGVVVEAVEGVYTGTIAGATKILVETKKSGEVVPTLAASLKFDKANRTEFDKPKQVYVQNGITFTNEKAKSTTDCADFAAPIRLYKGSSLKVEYTGIVKIVFKCNNASYATALKNSIGDAATVSGKEVTVTFATAADSFDVASLTAQVRLDSIDVYTMQ